MNENGHVRLLGKSSLPEKTKVFVVVTEAPSKPARIFSPILADPDQASAFILKMSRPAEA